MAEQISTDPISLAEQAIWDYLTTVPRSDPAVSTEFGDMVKAGNRLRGQIRKEEASPADFPMVRLIQTGGPIQIYASSNGSKFVWSWALQIATNQERSDSSIGGINPLQWAACRALARAVMDHLGLAFVKSLTLISSTTTDKPTEDEFKFGIRGWQSFLTISAECWFRTADLTC